MKLGVAGTVYTAEYRSSVEDEILSSIYTRLQIGKQQYGRFSRGPDGRSMTKEALEEVYDCLVYVAKRLIEIEAESGFDMANAGQAAVEDVPNPPKDGWEVRAPRPKKGKRKDVPARSKDSGGGTGGRRGANRNGGAKR